MNRRTFFAMIAACFVPVKRSVDDPALSANLRRGCRRMIAQNAYLRKYAQEVNEMLALAS